MNVIGETMALYVQASRLAVQSNLHSPSSWTEDLGKCLSRLRQTLACSVCGELVIDPWGPQEPICSHYVCRDCIGGKTRFVERSCSWCKDHSEFVANEQLTSVISCYIQLCKYLSTFFSPTSKPLDQQNPLEAIVREGSMLEESLLSSVKPTSTVMSLSGMMSLSRNHVRRARATILKRQRLKTDRLRVRKASSKKCGKLKEKYIPEYMSTEGYQSELPSDDLEEKSAIVSGRVEKQSPNNQTVILNGTSLRDNVNDSSKADDTKSIFVDSVVLSEHDYNRNNLDEGGLMSSVEGVLRRSNDNKYLRRLSSESGGIFSSYKKPAASSPPPTHNVVLHSTKASSMQPDIAHRQFTSHNVPRQPHVYSLEITHQKPIISSTGAIVRKSQKSKANRTGCRCAMATPNPGKLTCCGQRCPCYSAFKSCVDCRCRGCRNPRGDRPAPGSMQPLKVERSVSQTPVTFTLGRMLVSSHSLSIPHSVGRVTLT